MLNLVVPKVNTGL